jgi:pimeloyl-ACP methyl ester carboxylesterase
MELDLELYRRDVVVSDEPRVRLSAIDIEPGEAERAMVFLHGFGGRATQWKHQLQFFCEDNRVVAFDLRGHGASDKPDSEYTMDELLRDMERALEALAVPDKFVLAAHSFGGAIAISYAVQHPERVEKLILVSVSNDFRLRPQKVLPCHPLYVERQGVAAEIDRAHFDRHGPQGYCLSTGFLPGSDRGDSQRPVGDRSCVRPPGPVGAARRRQPGHPTFPGTGARLLARVRPQSATGQGETLVEAL